MTRHNIINVSGGKDSTALLLLAIERQTDSLQAVFADTGHEHSQTYEYIDYLDKHVHPIRVVKADFSARIAGKREFIKAKWAEHGIPQSQIDAALEVLQPTGNPFLDLCLWKGRFPSTKARFCSEELKRNPIIEQVQMPLMDAGNTVWSWQGVRANESLARRDLLEIEEVGGGLWNYRPILKWTAKQCFDMHRKHGVQHNPLYEQGMGRVGCMPCIHARKDELLEISKRFPEEIKRVAQWEEMVSKAAKRGRSSFFHASEGSVLYGQNHVWAVVDWSKTSRGGTQYDFLRMQNDGPMCSSIYGLCE